MTLQFAHTMSKFVQLLVAVANIIARQPQSFAGIPTWYLLFGEYLEGRSPASEPVSLSKIRSHKKTPATLRVNARVVSRIVSTERATKYVVLSRGNSQAWGHLGIGPNSYESYITQIVSWNCFGCTCGGSVDGACYASFRKPHPPPSSPSSVHLSLEFHRMALVRAALNYLLSGSLSLRSTWLIDSDQEI